MTRACGAFLLFALFLGLGGARAVHAGDAPPKPDPGAAARAEFYARVEADIQAALNDPDKPATPQGLTPCVGGFAGAYACNKVDLLAFMPIGAIGGGTANDIWGWTDPQDGAEYALFGRSSGTSFVDISDPENPVYLGNLPTHTTSSSWRDIKVYEDHAFIVSEASGHGMQVFDLTRLRSVANPPVTFTEDAHYPGFGNAHNIAINEDTGYAYAVGSNTCSGGLHFVNIQNPASPVGAGCYSADGYTHDTQCVIYTGPDTQHQGREICFSSNEDTLTIVDVTNHAAPVQLARMGYSGSSYTHQGWLTEDQTRFLMDDEGDETSFGHNTRTRVWNISNLDAPTVIGIYDGPNDSIDHNLYTRDGYAYMSNYTSGLQILDLVNVASGSLSEAAFFDSYTPNNGTSFSGSWSNYPYYESGVVVLTGIGEGLYIVLPTLSPDYAMSSDTGTLEVCVSGSDGAVISINPKSGYAGTVSLSAVGLPAGSSALFSPPAVVVPGTSNLTVTVTSTPPGSYPFNVHGDDGGIEHDEPVTLNVYAGAPGAPALTAPANGAVNVNQLPTFAWGAAGGAGQYYLQVATDAGFNNIVYTAATSGTSLPSGASLNRLTTYYWRVQAQNGCGGGTFSATFSFTVRDIPPVLLVDDDGVPSNIDDLYGDALTAAGVTFDYWNTTSADLEPAAIDLIPYQAIVWFTSELYGGGAGPSAPTEAALAAWLDAEACLFISSQDYHYDKGLTSFMTGYLGVASMSDDDGNYASVTGQGVFSGLGAYTLTYPFEDYSDPITIGNGGAQAMRGNNNLVAGVSKETAGYRTSFWAFPWEALPASGQTATMETFIEWCDIEITPPPPLPSHWVYLPIIVREP
jgi:choice-of-anchor B domain-containing protein